MSGQLADYEVGAVSNQEQEDDEISTAQESNCELPVELGSIPSSSRKEQMIARYGDAASYLDGPFLTVAACVLSYQLLITGNRQSGGMYLSKGLTRVPKRDRTCFSAFHSTTVAIKRNAVEKLVHGQIRTRFHSNIQRYRNLVRNVP